MKFIFLAGGFAGFALTAVIGLMAERSPDMVLRDAMIACIVSALLFRWFWSVLVRALTETVNAKRAAAEAALAAASAASSQKSK